MGDRKPEDARKAGPLGEGVVRHVFCGRSFRGNTIRRPPLPFGPFPNGQGGEMERCSEHKSRHKRAEPDRHELSMPDVYNLLKRGPEKLKSFRAVSK